MRHPDRFFVLFEQYINNIRLFVRAECVYRSAFVIQDKGSDPFADVYMRALAEHGYRRLLYLSAVGLLLTLLSACSEPPYGNVNNAELQMMLEQNTPIYDVRRPEEWRQTGVIEGSKLLTFVDASGRLQPDFIDRFTAAIGQNDPVILICRTGNRTSTLARLLVEQLGYTQVYNVRDGITRWISDDRPVTRL
jgi:rhodanese-related sulfurtransferase